MQVYIDVLVQERRDSCALEMGNRVTYFLHQPIDMHYIVMNMLLYSKMK